MSNTESSDSKIIHMKANWTAYHCCEEGEEDESLFMSDQDRAGYEAFVKDNFPEFCIYRITDTRDAFDFDDLIEIEVIDMNSQA